MDDQDVYRLLKVLTLFKPYLQSAEGKDTL